MVQSELAKRRKTNRDRFKPMQVQPCELVRRYKYSLTIIPLSKNEDNKSTCKKMRKLDFLKQGYFCMPLNSYQPMLICKSIDHEVFMKFANMFFQGNITCSSCISFSLACFGRDCHRLTTSVFGLTLKPVFSRLKPILPRLS